MAKPISRILFDKYDKDNSGSINVKELGSLCYDKGYFLNDAELAQAMKVVDTDKSGSVTYDEFQKWWKNEDRFKRLSGVDEKEEERLSKTAAFFQYYDKNKNGDLSKDEFKALHAQLSNTPGYMLGDFESCWTALEAGGAGAGVNFNAFVAWLQSLGQKK